MNTRLAEGQVAQPIFGLNAWEEKTQKRIRSFATTILPLKYLAASVLNLS